MRRTFLTLLLPAILVGTGPAVPAMAAVHGSPDLAAQVRVAPTAMSAGTSSVDIGPTLWSVQGLTLGEILGKVYGIDPARIDLGSAAGGQRFDINLPLRGNETDEAIQAALKTAIERQFGLRLSFETRTVHAYVLSAPSGAGNELRRASFQGTPDSGHGTPGAVTVSGQLCPDFRFAVIGGHAASISALAAALQENLDGPVLDETRLSGLYDFELPGYRSTAELFTVLKDRLGISVTATNRQVQVLVAQPVQAAYELRAGL